MGEKHSVLSDIVDTHTKETLASVSPEGRAIVQVISSAIEKLRSETATNHAEAAESRKGLDARLAVIEDHLNPDRLAKRAEQDTQLAILWAAAKIVAATVATAVIVGVLTLLGLHK